MQLNASPCIMDNHVQWGLDAAEADAARAWYYSLGVDVPYGMPYPVQLWVDWWRNNAMRIGELVRTTFTL